MSMTEKHANTPTDAAKAKAAEELKKSANQSELTSSPALNNDALTDSGGAGEQSLPKGNRFD